MYLADKISIGEVKKTADGFVAVRARAARTGIYEYSANEVGAPDSFARDATIKVYRPVDEVFDARSVASFTGKPVTRGHPVDPVTPQNYRDHARGAVMGALREGDYLAFDMMLMDADLIDAVNRGERELSNGYSCELDWTPGKTTDGQAYDAVQRMIRGNHVAVVDRARAGSECKIGDRLNFAACDSIPLMGDKEVTTKTIMVDGLQVVVTDAAEAAIIKLQGQIADAKAAADKALADKATVEAVAATHVVEIADLKAKLADAAITPEKLRDAAKAYAVVVDKAKALGVSVTDTMSESDVVKAVVKAKLGDACNGWTDAQFTASFATIAAPVKDGLTEAFATGNVAPFVGDVQSVRDANYAKYVKSLSGNGKAA